MLQQKNNLIFLTSFIIFTLFFNAEASGQKLNLYVPGKIVSTSNDTIIGLIKDKIEGKDITKIQYKDHKQPNKSSTISIDRIQSIYFENGITYEKVLIEDTPQLLTKLVEGKISLYRKFGKKSRTYYILEPGRTVILTNDRNAYTKESKLNKEKYKLRIIDRTRVDAEYNKVADDRCRHLKNIQYKLKDRFLINHVTQLNDCMNQSVKLFPSNQIIHQWSTTAGSSKIYGENVGNVLVLGLHYNKFSVRFNRKVSLLNNLHYLQALDENRFLITFSSAINIKFGFGKIQPYLYFSSSILFDSKRGNWISENGRFGVLPIGLGTGFDIPLNDDLGIKAEISVGAILLPTIGLTYFVRRSN